MTTIETRWTVEIFDLNTGRDVQNFNRSPQFHSKEEAESYGRQLFAEKCTDAGAECGLLFRKTDYSVGFNDYGD